MVRLKPRYKLHLPHGLAMAGALLLLASTVTGVGSALQSGQGQPLASTSTMIGEHEADAPGQSSDSVEAVRQVPVKKTKGFKLKLFLFRR
jgi:hypothetical protein